MIHPAGSDSLLLGFPLNENGYVNTRLVFLSEGLETHEFQLLHVFWATKAAFLRVTLFSKLVHILNDLENTLPPWISSGGTTFCRKVWYAQKQLSIKSKQKNMAKHPSPSAPFLYEILGVKQAICCTTTLICHGRCVSKDSTNSLRRWSRTDPNKPTNWSNGYYKINLTVHLKECHGDSLIPLEKNKSEKA